MADGSDAIQDGVASPSQDAPPAAPDRARTGAGRQLDLLERAITAIHDERRPGDGLRTALQLIARHNGWRIGHVYQRKGDPPRAVPTGIWFDDAPQENATFRDALRAIQRTTGARLATRVLETREPVWIDDLTAILPDGAPSVPLRVLAMFPVMTSARPVAVLEFCAEPTIQPDWAFMRVMRAVGIQLGYLVERHQLQQRLARVTVQQQREIAMELHDTVGQEATALGILARMLHQDLSRKAVPEAELAVRLLDGVQRMKLRIRDFLSLIRPMEIQPGALKDELEQIAERYARLGQCACAVDVDGTIDVTDAFAATKIVRIAREAVHNAVKHGRPRNIRIRFQRHDADTVELEIVDDGTGADAAALMSGGIGQESMRYRADLLSADLAITTAPGGGVRVRCRIPVESLSEVPDAERME